MNNERDTVLEVTGMSCGSCVRHVSSALGDLAGVRRVQVRLQDGVVEVTHDASLTSKAKLIAALDEAGYAARVRAA